MNKSSLHSIGEFGLIEKIKKWTRTKSLLLVKGIGDDAAVFRASKGKYQLISIDTIIEGVDFKLNQAGPEQIGHKALAVNLSDMAAMAGTPRFAVVSLTLPPRTSFSFVKRFYSGMSRLAKKFKVDLIGGDLSHGKELSCTVTILGESLPKHTLFREGARAGDLICVTGDLGGSILGKHLSFTPRVKEAQLIARFGAHSLIDISDGLIQDLGHLLEKKNLAFGLDEKKVPVSKFARKLGGKSTGSALQHALYDGEDFELLFTISKGQFEKLKRHWSFAVRLSSIGRVIRKTKSWKNPYSKSGYTRF